jgi:hypothetical protein
MYMRVSFLVLATANAERGGALSILLALAPVIDRKLVHLARPQVLRQVALFPVPFAIRGALPPENLAPPFPAKPGFVTISFGHSFLPREPGCSG